MLRYNINDVLERYNAASFKKTELTLEENENAKKLNI